MSAHDPKRSTVNRGILLVAIAILIPWLLTTLFFAVDRDGGAFLTIANGIIDGKLPYGSFFDHKPPGFYYALAAALALTGRSIWGVKILLLLLGLGTAAFAAQALSRLGTSRQTQLMGAAFLLAGWVVYQGYTPVTETLAAACVAAAIAFVLSNRNRGAFAAGILLGVATLSKQPSALLLLPFLGYAFAIGRWKACLAVLSAFILPLATASGLLVASGVGEAAWHQIVTVNLTSLPTSVLRDIVKGNFDLFLAAPTLWAAACLSLLTVRQRETRFLVGLTLISLLPTLLNPTSHYMLITLPPLALSAALGMQQIRTSEQASHRALVFLALSPLLFQAFFPMLAAFSHNVLLHQIEAGRRLNALAQPGAPILVIAAEPQYYFFSGHYPPGPDLYLLPINHSPEKEQDMIQRVETGEISVIAAKENAFTDKFGSIIFGYVQTHCQRVDHFPEL